MFIQSKIMMLEEEGIVLIDHPNLPMNEVVMIMFEEGGNIESVLYTISYII